MPSKGETLFYRDVNKRLDATVYREKMYNPLRGGTPDFYYERKRSLWCEYKWLYLPARDDSPVHGEVTPLQGEWLDRCEANGHKPWAIVGSVLDGKKIGVIFENYGWNSPISRADFLTRALTLDQLAQAIYRRTS